MEPIPGLDALLSELPGAIEQDIWGCDPELLAVFDGFQTEGSDGSHQPAASEEVEGALSHPCATPAYPSALPSGPSFQKPASTAYAPKAPTSITITTTTVGTATNLASPSCSPACPRPAPSVHATAFQQQQQQHPGYHHDPGASSRQYNVRPRRAVSPPSCSSDDTGAMSSDSGGEDAPAISKRQAAANKRKAPEVDWRSITDPAERRKQRRLAKNRVTAARSRERKKEQWTEMQAQLSALQADNTSLKAALEAALCENAQLKQQLGSLNRGLAAAAATTGQGAEPALGMP